MKKRLRFVVLGLGLFGSEWAQVVHTDASGFAELVGVVDQDPKKFTDLPSSIPRFADIETAIAAVKPDGVVNVTPPGAHVALNMAILAQGVPVLCEKPIAETYEDSHKIADFARKNGTCFMISENYRFHPFMRRGRELILSGELGAVHSVSQHFRHHHPDAAHHYHGQIAQPLLTDVTVHHLDAARYLTGEEPLTVWAQTWDAPWSWYARRPASAVIHTQMSGRVVYDYLGTLASPVSTTDWGGIWEVECDHSVLRLTRQRIQIYRADGRVESISTNGEREDAPEDTRCTVLREFAAAITEGRRGETDIEDNFKSYTWVMAAIKAAEEKRPVAITEFEA